MLEVNHQAHGCRNPVLPVRKYQVSDFNALPEAVEYSSQWRDHYSGPTNSQMAHLTMRDHHTCCLTRAMASQAVGLRAIVTRTTDRLAATRLAQWGSVRARDPPPHDEALHKPSYEHTK